MGALVSRYCGKELLYPELQAIASSLESVGILSIIPPTTKVWMCITVKFVVWYHVEIEYPTWWRVLRAKGRRDCQERIRRVELSVSPDTIMFVGLSSFQALEKFNLQVTKQNFLAFEPPTRSRGYFLKVILCYWPRSFHPLLLEEIPVLPSFTIRTRLSWINTCVGNTIRPLWSPRAYVHVSQSIRSFGTFRRRSLCLCVIL